MTPFLRSIIHLAFYIVCFVFYLVFKGYIFQDRLLDKNYRRWQETKGELYAKIIMGVIVVYTLGLMISYYL